MKITLMIILMLIIMEARLIINNMSATAISKTKIMNIAIIIIMVMTI